MQHRASADELSWVPECVISELSHAAAADQLLLGLTCVQLCHFTFVEIGRRWWFSLCVFELPEIHIRLLCAFGISCLLPDVIVSWAVLLYMVFTPADSGGDAVLAALQVLKGAGGNGPLPVQLCGPEHSQGPCWNKTWLMSLLAVSRPEDKVVICFGYCCWSCAEGPPQGFFSTEVRGTSQGVCCLNSSSPHRISA